MASAEAEGTKLRAVGVTNQRETLVCWSKATGKPLCHAIVWMDTRTQGVVDALVSEHGGDGDALRSKCGLPFATYFSGVKLRWLVRKPLPCYPCVTADTFMSLPLSATHTATMPSWRTTRRWRRRRRRAICSAAR